MNRQRLSVRWVSAVRNHRVIYTSAGRRFLVRTEAVPPPMCVSGSFPRLRTVTCTVQRYRKRETRKRGLCGLRVFVAPSTFHVPTFHVSSFHPPRPLRSGHVRTGWFDHSASQGTWQNTITDVRPQGSGAFSTFHVPASTFLRSHVPR